MKKSSILSIVGFSCGLLFSLMPFLIFFMGAISIKDNGLNMRFFESIYGVISNDYIGGLYDMSGLFAILGLCTGIAIAVVCLFGLLYTLGILKKFLKFIWIGFVVLSVVFFIFAIASCIVMYMWVMEMKLTQAYNIGSGLIMLVIDSIFCFAAALLTIPKLVKD